MMAFHFQAAPEIGTGHARRCAALSHALTDDGSDISLVADTATLAFARTIMPEGCQLIPVGDTPQAIQEAVSRLRPACLILDRYDLPPSVESALASNVGALAVFDDIPGRPHTCDFLIDQNIGSSAAAWQGAVSSQAIVLASGAYAQLRPEFAEARRKRTASMKKMRVFVCFGGADPLGLTDWLCPAMTCLLRAGCAVDIVVGGETAHLDRLKAFANAWPDAELHIASNDVAGLMTRASVAIGAPGSMTLERACTGLPQILVSFAENQIEVGKLAETADVVRYLGDWQSLQAKDVATAALDLLNEPDAIRRMGRRAQRLVDGRGARRVAAALLPERDRKGAPVRLRPMERADIETVFRWQNSDGIRKYALNPQKIAWEEHLAWSTNRLQCFQLETYLSYDNDRNPIGFLHLKPYSEGGWMVSLLVAPEAQGRGIGQAMLRQLTRIYRDERLYALIKRENTPSIKAFLASGFVKKGAVYVREPLSEVA